MPNEPKTVVIKTFFLIRYNFNTFDGTNKTYAMGLEYGSTDLFMLPLIDLVLLLLTSQLFLYGRWPFSTEEVNFGRCKWRKQRRGLYVICNLFSTILSMSHLETNWLWPSFPWILWVSGLWFVPLEKIRKSVLFKCLDLQSWYLYIQNFLK